MHAEVTALQIDGRPLSAASMNSASLRPSGDDWTVTIRSQWSSDLCDRIRRSGAIDEAPIRVSTEAGGFSGVGRVEFYGEVDSGIVEVRVVGQGALSATAMNE